MLQDSLSTFARVYKAFLSLELLQAPACVPPPVWTNARWMHGSLGDSVGWMPSYLSDSLVCLTCHPGELCEPFP